MLIFLTRSASMRVVWVLMACAVSGRVGAGNIDESVVTVEPLLLKEPSADETTMELGSVGVKLTEPAELIPGDTVYLEIWFQTRGPNGIVSAVLDISYETDLLDTSLKQVTLASQWMDVFASVRVVDDVAGLITDVGGASLVGYGLEPHWAKLATIEFDVIKSPDTGISACTLDGGPQRGFGMLGIGAVEGIDYRCACVEESSLATLGTFLTCLSGPDGTAAQECTCADRNRDTHVDLADFAAFQVAFRDAFGSVCGNGFIEPGEQCEPPGGACCDENCQNSAGSFSADNCSEAVVLCDGEATFVFENTSATQDGPPHTRCIEFGEDQIDNDVWACWTAPCTGTVFVSTCDLTAIDTKIAVYEGCTCPVTDAGLLSCNDDVCEVQSITSFEAAAGQGYLIRLGTFLDEAGGTGAVNISCGLSVCPSAGDCSIGHDTPGCDDQDCCETVCAVDPICCDAAKGQWDGICADEAAGFCTGSFAACEANAGSCADPKGNGTPGCEDVECCNAVCLVDPFCCVDVWDKVCAENEAAICFSTCGPKQGNCLEANGTPGCEIENCCAEVCPRDSFCCQVEWDGTCAGMAAVLCPLP